MEQPSSPRYTLFSLSHVGFFAAEVSPGCDCWHGQGRWLYPLLPFFLSALYFIDPKLMERINAFFEEAKHFCSLLAWRWIRAVQLFIDVSVHGVKLHLCPHGRRLPFSLVIGHLASPLAIHAALLLSFITWPLTFDCFDFLVDALARCLKRNELLAWLDEHAVRSRQFA